MESLTSAISVQVDTKDKENANEILKNLGLNMSTFVNMAIKQLLYTNGLPFEVKNPLKENIAKNETNNISDVIKEKSTDNYNTINTMPNLADFIK
ncbi:MAG: type II toxin-antitoxin system RelB/DinJ family antitoxin [Bacilli bacterium]|nr:type II toxin-antitoxin system RelB/DinJ family antitoxin [Bacilli bacterium]